MNLEFRNGNNGNMETGARGRSIRVRVAALSLFGRAEGKTEKRYGTERGFKSFHRSHNGSQIHNGYLAIGIREGKAKMTTAELMKEFTKKSTEVRQQALKLNDILQDITADNCPLSPCNNCILVRCALRRIAN